MNIVPPNEDHQMQCSRAELFETPLQRELHKYRSAPTRMKCRGKLFLSSRIAPNPKKKRTNHPTGNGILNFEYDIYCRTDLASQPKWAGLAPPQGYGGEHAAPDVPHNRQDLMVQVSNMTTGVDSSTTASDRYKAVSAPLPSNLSFI